MEYKLAKLFDASGDLSKQWFIFYYYRHPETGKYERFRIWISKKILTKAKRYQVAKEKITTLNLKLKNGYNPYVVDELRFTNVSEALSYVYNIKVTQIRKRSDHTYKSVLNRFFEYLKSDKIQSKPVDEINHYHAMRFMDFLKVRYKVSNRTYNNYITHMRTLFNELVTREYIQGNPFSRIKKLPQEESKITFYTTEERELIKSNLPSIDFNFYVITQLIFYCFLRPQEIVRLKVGCFEIEKERIIIEPWVSKNKRQQVVVIPTNLKTELLKLNLSRFPSDYFAFSREFKPGTKQIAPTRLAGAWSNYRATLGINKKLYELKHTGVGLAIEAGINIRDLQLQLRHHSLEMTQIYLNKFNNIASETLIRKFPDF